MHIIITAGGTYESIDAVRRITNTSTGALGAQIGQALMGQADLLKTPLILHYVHGAKADLRGLGNSKYMTLHLYPITDTASVEQTLTHLLTQHPIDAIFHLMAISDFTVTEIQSLKGAASIDTTPLHQQKLNSDSSYQITLTPTPKIIQMIKKISPQLFLIGFKLLNQVTQDQLREAGLSQIHSAQSDWVVCNDAARIHDSVHEAFVMDKDGILEHFTTKRMIAKRLVERLFKEVFQLEIKDTAGRKQIVVGVTGGIACYKAVEIVNDLHKRGYGVHVIMTQNATEFVTPLTFQTLSHHPVTVGQFDAIAQFEIEHISLAQKADLVLIVPATGNIIGKIAHGIADDMLTTTVMATQAPVVIAPAMNTVMWENPIVQANIEKLIQYGYTLLPTDTGRLACGDVGSGKLLPWEQIVAHVISALND